MFWSVSFPNPLAFGFSIFSYLIQNLFEPKMKAFSIFNFLSKLEPYSFDAIEITSSTSFQFFF
jgi:hypothetical protein